MSYCRMYLTTKMDRPVIRDEHYISPGGYEFEFDNNRRVRFDFNESAGTIRLDEPTVVDWVLRDYECLDDKMVDENEFAALLVNHSVTCIKEAFVYTGEDEDPEINLVKIQEIFLDVFDTDKKKHYAVLVAPAVISAYNKQLGESVA